MVAILKSDNDAIAVVDHTVKDGIHILHVELLEIKLVVA